MYGNMNVKFGFLVLHMNVPKQLRFTITQTFVTTLN